MTNYYISKTGNNANAGTTTATAWATIARAGSAGSVVTAGDVVNILAGTYTLGTITTTKSGASGNPVTYKSPTPWAAKIVGTAASDAICWTNTGAFVVIDGIDLMTYGRIGIYMNANDNEIKNCYIHDVLYSGTPSCGGGGAGIQNNGARWNVHHNLIVRVDQAREAGACWPTAGEAVHGIYLGGANVSSSATIWNNIVADIAGYGIHCWHGATQEKIYNNAIMNCHRAGILIGGGDSGMLPGGNSSAKVYNNICFNNSTYGIREYGRVSACVYTNNMLFGPYAGANQMAFDANNPPYTDGVEAGRISASPRFVNYVSDGSGDYHLSAGSAAIGAANTLYVPSNDFDYVARPVGGTYDVGPYEFIPSGQWVGTNYPVIGGNLRKRLRT